MPCTGSPRMPMTHSNLLSVTDPWGAWRAPLRCQQQPHQCAGSERQPDELRLRREGPAITVTDPLGYTIQTAYDALDRKNSVTDRNGNQTDYSYDQTGNLIAVDDALDM